METVNLHKDWRVAWDSKQKRVYYWHAHTREVQWDFPEAPSDAVPEAPSATTPPTTAAPTDNTNDVAGMKVAELQAELRKRKLSTKGKKATLQARLRQAQGDAAVHLPVGTVPTPAGVSPTTAADMLTGAVAPEPLEIGDSCIVTSDGSGGQYRVTRPTLEKYLCECKGFKFYQKAKHPRGAMRTCRHIDGLRSGSMDAGEIQSAPVFTPVAVGDGAEPLKVGEKCVVRETHSGSVYKVARDTPTGYFCACTGFKFGNKTETRAPGDERTCKHIDGLRNGSILPGNIELTALFTPRMDKRQETDEDIAEAGVGCIVAPPSISFASMGVSQLKECLRANNQLLSGKKCDLLARCQERHCNGSLDQCHGCGGGKLRFAALIIKIQNPSSSTCGIVLILENCLCIFESRIMILTKLPVSLCLLDLLDLESWATALDGSVRYLSCATSIRCRMSSFGVRGCGICCYASIVVPSISPD